MPSSILAACSSAAQALAAQLVARAGQARADQVFAEVDIASLELVQPRSVGIEHVGLHALARSEFEPLLASLGINPIKRAMILAQVVAGMAAPGSELATWQWLNDESAQGELLDLSFTDLSLMRLFRAGDLPVRHQAAIESALFDRVQTLFGFEAAVTLYDLTNTYFEGQAADNPKAKRGRSKEKRGDSPLLTLGLILAGSGFVRRSNVLAGNALECRALAGMLADLAAPAGAWVVMDRGIATATDPGVYCLGSSEVTASLTQRDGRTLSIRKATQPDPRLKAMYDALGVDPLPGGTKRLAT